MTSLAFEADAGAAGLLYSVGSNNHVCALDAASGAQVVKFKAGSHPLSCVGAAPGQPHDLTCKALMCTDQLFPASACAPYICIVAEDTLNRSHYACLRCMACAAAMWAHGCASVGGDCVFESQPLM